MTSSLPSLSPFTLHSSQFTVPSSQFNHQLHEHPEPDTRYQIPDTPDTGTGKLNTIQHYRFFFDSKHIEYIENISDWLIPFSIPTLSSWQTQGEKSWLRYVTSATSTSTSTSTSAATVMAIVPSLSHSSQVRRVNLLVLVLVFEFIKLFACADRIVFRHCWQCIYDMRHWMGLTWFGLNWIELGWQCGVFCLVLSCLVEEEPMWFYNLLEEMALRLFIPFLMAINIQYIVFVFRIKVQGMGSRFSKESRKRYILEECVCGHCVSKLWQRQYLGMDGLFFRINEFLPTTLNLFSSRLGPEWE